MRDIIDALPDPLLTFSADGVIDSVNPAAARLFDCHPRDLVGTKIGAMIPALETNLATETRDALARRLDGRTVPIRVTAAAIETGYFVHIRDLSEADRDEAESRRTQRMAALDQLCGRIAHDFKGAISTLRATGELLVGGLPDGHELRSTAEDVVRTAERATTVANRLLVFREQQNVLPTLIDLNATIDRAEPGLRALIGADVELVKRLAAKLGLVRADEKQIDQLLNNLVANAREAMPKGGKLTLETAKFQLNDRDARLHQCKPGAYVMLSIADTGVGVSPEDKAKLFEPFFTTKEPGKCFGLGLVAVENIVKQWGGLITVDGNPGRGSTFTVLLPKSNEKPSAAQSEGKVEPLGGSETILVADDDAALRDVMPRILKPLGYDLLLAASGAEAIALAERPGRKPIQLLVTDMVMEGMSGPELASRLGKTVPGLRVLFISGYSEEMTRGAGFLAQGIGFLAKPFSIDELAAKVREMLDAR